MQAVNVFVEEGAQDQGHSKKISNIKVDMKDLILTPHTCACIVIEVLKILLYEKLQLPYPYAWLKSAIAKRKPVPNIHTHNISIILQKYFNLASNAFKAVEDITMHLSAMMATSGHKIQEIVILFGSTPYTPKEVFTIKFPELARGHTETNHRSMLQKKLNKVLRTVFLSEDWLHAMQHQVQVTNTFLMVKKIGSLRHDDSYFEHYNNFVVPPNVHNTIITLNYDQKNDTCCENLRVYGDHRASGLPSIIHSIESRNVEWYQAKGVIKGFQDFFIEKVSVSELW